MINPISFQAPLEFFNRVVTHDAFRKGVAGAIAGSLVAVVSEAIIGGSDD